MECIKRFFKIFLFVLKNNVVENFLDLVEKLKRLKISKDNFEFKEFKVCRCLMVVISEFEDRILYFLSILDCLFDYGLNCYICL